MMEAVRVIHENYQKALTYKIENTDGRLERKMKELQKSKRSSAYIVHDGSTNTIHETTKAACAGVWEL